MEPQTQMPERQNPLLIPFSLIIAGAFIGAGIYFASKGPSGRVLTSQENTVEDIMMRPITDEDHILGNPNADVIIVEYSDTECPFCKTFQVTMQRIMNEYGAGGRVAWVYRHFPIDSLHPKARKEAEATECAKELGGNGKFWEYIDAVFSRTPSNNGLDLAELPKIAESVDISVSKFNSCLESGRYAKKVEADYQDALLAGGTGTPYSVLVMKNGEKVAIKGAQPYEVLKTIIDTALANLPVN